MARQGHASQKSRVLRLGRIPRMNRTMQARARPNEPRFSEGTGRDERSRAEEGGQTESMQPEPEPTRPNHVAPRERRRPAHGE